MKTTFLYSNLQEKIYKTAPEIYMTVPEGLEAYLKFFTPKFQLDPNLDCLLLKSLYGLKHSPQQWYQYIDQFLLLHGIGFLTLTSNANIYIQKDTTQGFLILTINIDDCILVSNKISLIDHLKNTLQKEFDMSDDGELHYMLGNIILRY